MSDGVWDKGPMEALFLTPQVSETFTEGAALSPQCLEQEMGGVVHDSGQFGQGLPRS